MRVRFLLAATAAVAVFCGASAQAQMSESSISLDVKSFFTPQQFGDDGSVYGVRARAAASQLPTIQIMTPGNSPTSTSLTPDPCNSSGNFPGGWCQSAHSVAANTFGWNFSAGGKGVIIGIVDTGIDLNNPEFLDSSGNSRVLQGYCIQSAANPCTNFFDIRGGDTAIFPGADSTHGTHTAGIAAGLNVGIANQASILPVKVCSSTADSCDDVDQGMIVASQHGAAIISVSIGGPVIAASDIDAFRTVAANGSLMVVAGGNSGNKDPSGGFLAGGALADGVRGSMIVVGATGCNGPNPSVPTNCANNGLGGIASFSQVPGNRCEIHEGARYCLKDYFVMAPGVDIWSSVGNGSNGAAHGPDYNYLSGTSMATPYVSGVAAVIKGASPFLTAEEVADIIFNSTDDMGATGIDPVYGRGAVDITKAMSPAGSPAQIKVATSGAVGNPGSVSGASNATTSLVSGALSVAVSKSTLLKNVEVIDAYGRAFGANLTAATYNPGVDLGRYFFSSNFTSFSPFVFASDSPIGNLVATGYAVDTTTPRLISGEFQTRDRDQYSVQDLNITATLAKGVELNAGYNTLMSGSFSGYDVNASQAYDGLFMQAAAVNSPYASFTDGGSFLGTNIQVADGVHVRFGASELGVQRGEYEAPVFSMVSQLQGPQAAYSQRQAQATLAGVDWDYASWGGIGMVATQTSEQNGLLGGLNSGALAMAGNANTSAVGLNARFGFGDGWVTTLSYSEGLTQLDLKADSLITGSDPLHSRAYGVAVAKHGLFDDNDSLGIAVSRPVQIYSGGIDLTAANGVDSNGNLTIGHEHLSLASSTPETDFELGYVTTFMNGAVSLQANAGYQSNVAGQSGLNGVTVLSRAKLNF
ncbi:MAG TPA: S8 family peptidase [Rhizomicrobium sp.]|jgi:subtilisin family serine protease